MKNRYARLCQVMALALLACFCLSVLAVAQDSAVNDEHAVGRFVVISQESAPKK